MKKTLITFFALGSAAMGASLSSFTQISTTSTYTWDTALASAPGGWTLALTLDSAVLRPYMEKNTPLYGDEYAGEIPQGALISGNASSGLQIVDVTLNNSTNSRIGIDTNFGSSGWVNEYSTIASSGLYGSWNGGGSNSKPVGNYAMASPDFASLDWDNIGSIAITLSYQYTNTDGNGTNMAVAIFDKEGNQIGQTTYGSDTSLRTNASLKSITFSDAVTSAYLLDSRVLKDDAKAIATELGQISVVPEPTTATLSLLALAGLAARRRRR